MKVAALFRVSTEKQENEGASLDAQQRRFRELAKANRWQVVAEFRGQESAAKVASERAVLQRLLACLREQDVDAVWVIEQSRLTRGDELEMALLMRELVERNVSVIVGTDVRNLADTDRKMVFRIQSAVDAAERDRFRERVTRGRREKARQGKKTGGKAPYGYRNPPPGDPKRGTLQPHPEEASTVRRIFRDVARGVTLRALEAQLTAEGIPAPRGGRWGRSTVRRILESPVYLGTQVCGAWRVEKGTGTVRLDLNHPEAIVTPGAHEPLISPAERDAAFAQLRATSNGRPALLTGMLYLGAERAWVDGGHGSSYYCPASRRPGPWIRAEDLNRIVWQGFRRLVTAPRAVSRLLGAVDRREAERHLAGEMGALRAHRERLAARLARLVDMRADGEITRQEFEDRTASNRRAIAEAEARGREVERQRQAASSGTLEKTLAALRLLVADRRLTDDQRRRALGLLVESVYVQAEPRGEPQQRTRGGRFGPAPGPRWQVRDVLLRLQPTPGLSTTDC